MRQLRRTSECGGGGLSTTYAIAGEIAALWRRRPCILVMERVYGDAIVLKITGVNVRR